MAKKSPEITIGIDLGGTKILAIAVDSDHRVIANSKGSTPVAAGVAGICSRMKELADETVAKTGVSWDRIHQVGIAVPTSIDPATGDALHAPALGWRNQPVKPAVEEIFGRPVVLENDVNCGTLAEAKTGAAKSQRIVVGYFVGTGLGGGIVINGKLHTGLKGAGAELGHEVVRANGRRCGCGKKGCIEAYCSKTAFCRQFEKLLPKQPSLLSKLGHLDFSSGIKSKVLKKAYRAEDEVVCSVLNKGMEMLGIACANMMSVIGPDCIVIGGGVIEALGKELMPVIEKSTKEHLFAFAPEDVNLKLSRLGDNAVPLGAAILAGN